MAVFDREVSAITAGCVAKTMYCGKMLGLAASVLGSPEIGSYAGADK
jgi:hypothetical protein